MKLLFLTQQGCSRHLLLLCRIGVAAAFLAGVVGCKPTPSASTGQPTPSESSTARQPTTADLQAFFQSQVPAVIKVVEVRNDPPVRIPNTSPANNAWLLKVKLVITPTEDLLDLPAAADVQPFNDLVAELNGFVAWRNAYVRSPYSRTYGPYEVKVPASIAPQLLIITQSKDKPLPPLYGKVTAEWQMDHWQFENIDLQLPEVGKPHVAFTGGPTMVKGSPEAEAFLAGGRKALKDAKEQQAAIEDHFAKDLAAATKAGTTYQGQIGHPRGVLPCGVRFVETPGADSLTATFEVRLTQQPSYLFTYVAKLAPELPLNIPKDAPTSSIYLTSDTTNQSAPVGNLTVSCVRYAGQSSIANNLPGLMVSGSYTWTNKPLLLLDGHFTGTIADFNGGFALQADKR